MIPKVTRTVKSGIVGMIDFNINISGLMVKF